MPREGGDRLEGCVYEPRNARDCWQPLGERPGQMLPGAPMKEQTLLTPSFGTSSLRNGKRVNFCCFNHPGAGVCYGSACKLITGSCGLRGPRVWAELWHSSGGKGQWLSL